MLCVILRIIKTMIVKVADLLAMIGPHVDNYDVFLIQMTGSRLWEVGTRLVSVAEEMEDLVDGLDVRVLALFGIPMDGGDDGHIQLAT